MTALVLPAENLVAGRSTALRASNVRKRYGSVVALDDVSIEIRAGEIMTLLGPSGSGKTTLLKAIAGFEHLDGGSIFLEQTNITHLAPAQRNIGMVFQNYALFPHMTVAQNVAFPLRMRKVALSEVTRRVAEVLALVELSHLGERFPKQISGGQQQRVALARAIVFNPPLLLLDEPFSALDRQLRETMQLELKRLQGRLNLTTLFVTHDQEEALILSDRIAVMNRGIIEQVAAPSEVYENPASHFVASFVGECNLLDGIFVEAVDARSRRFTLATGEVLTCAAPDAVAGDKAKIAVRPERVRIVPEGELDENKFRAVVLEEVYAGGSTKYVFELESGLTIIARALSHKGLRPHVGATVWISWSALDMRVVM